MSKVQKLSSIYFQWDQNGNISHSTQHYFNFDKYQQTDGLLLSVVLLISGQLGILKPEFGLYISNRILNFLRNPKITPDPIKNPLNSVQVDLIQSERTVICTFHPSYLNSGTMPPEEAVSRLLGNLPPYLYQQLDIHNRYDAELFRFFKVGLLAVIDYYLTDALPKGISSGFFSKIRFKQMKVQFEMLKFTESFFPYWKGGLNLPETEFYSRLEKTQQHFKGIYKKHYSL